MSLDSQKKARLAELVKELLRVNAECFRLFAGF